MAFYSFCIFISACTDRVCSFNRFLYLKRSAGYLSPVARTFSASLLNKGRVVSKQSPSITETLFLEQSFLLVGGLSSQNQLVSLVLSSDSHWFAFIKYLTLYIL